MGVTHSTCELIDFQINRANSKRFGLYFSKPKNAAYYTGERFFVVPYHLYPKQYTRGYLYGYYESPPPE